jgi:hypothetical protein
LQTFIPLAIYSPATHNGTSQTTPWSGEAVAQPSLLATHGLLLNVEQPTTLEVVPFISIVDLELMMVTEVTAD